MMRAITFLCWKNFMNILVIGAHGQIGQQLLPKLAQDGHQVVAMVRDTSQCEALEDEHIKCVFGDLEKDFEDAFDGVDGVVFTAGSGGSTGADKTARIDLWGAIKSIQAAQKYGAKRFVMVSSIGADEPDSGPDPMKHYLIAKHLADEELKRSKLDWTILRPGELLNEPGSGNVSTERPARAQQKIPREDVASVIAACFSSDNAVGNTYELFSGEHNINELFA